MAGKRRRDSVQDSITVLGQAPESEESESFEEGDIRVSKPAKRTRVSEHSVVEIAPLFFDLVRSSD